jgi:hypothetical protein
VSIHRSLVLKLQSLTLVTSICESRVYWVRSTEAGKLPCLQYSIKGGKPASEDNCDTNLLSLTVEILCRSRDQEEARQLWAELVSSSGIANQSWDLGGTLVQIARVTSILPEERNAEPHNDTVCGAEFEVIFDAG